MASSPSLLYSCGGDATTCERTPEWVTQSLYWTDPELTREVLVGESPTLSLTPDGKLSSLAESRKLSVLADTGPTDCGGREVSDTFPTLCTCLEGVWFLETKSCVCLPVAPGVSKVLLHLKLNGTNYCDMISKVRLVFPTKFPMLRRDSPEVTCLLVVDTRYSEYLQVAVGVRVRRLLWHENRSSSYPLLPRSSHACHLRF